MLPFGPGGFGSTGLLRSYVRGEYQVTERQERGLVHSDQKHLGNDLLCIVVITWIYHWRKKKETCARRKSAFRANAVTSENSDPKFKAYVHFRHKCSQVWTTTSYVQLWHWMFPLSFITILFLVWTLICCYFTRLRVTQMLLILANYKSQNSDWVFIFNA